MNLCLTHRSSHPEVFCKKGVPRNFAKFTGKDLCQSLFSNKVASNFIKKETLAQVFSCQFCETSKNTFLTEHLWWLFLYPFCSSFLMAICIIVNLGSGFSEKGVFGILNPTYVCLRALFCNSWKFELVESIISALSATVRITLNVITLDVITLRSNQYSGASVEYALVCLLFCMLALLFL